MKKYIISNVQHYTETGENKDLKLQMFELEGNDDMQVSDGYHSMDELYEHRITLFIALCRQISNQPDCERGGEINLWRAKVHADGSSYDGWFIMGIGMNKGHQISYHIPISYWDYTYFAGTLDKAPIWDGHTSKDVLERLKKL